MVRRIQRRTVLYINVSSSTPQAALRGRTFSNPKNLSLPSGRIGPDTSSRCFSNFVGCGAFGSFLDGAVVAFEPDFSCSDPCHYYSLIYVSPTHTALPLNFPKNDISLCAHASHTQTTEPLRRSNCYLLYFAVKGARARPRISSQNARGLVERYVVLVA